MHFTPLFPSANAVMQQSDQVVAQLSAQCRRPLHSSDEASIPTIEYDNAHPTHVLVGVQPPPYSPRRRREEKSVRVCHSMTNLQRTSIDKEERCPSYEYETVVGKLSSSQRPVGGTFADREPPMSLELLVGRKLTTKLAKKRDARRLARVEQVHDAWLALGLDTRAIVAKGCRLPPYFWNPPRYNADEMNRRLKQLCL